MLDWLAMAAGFFLGMFVTYCTAYAKYKAKNKALFEDAEKLAQDAGKLEREKQNVIADFSEKIELLKKEHTVDIEHRKYKYESKQAEYAQFMMVLNEVGAADADLLMKDFLPLLESYAEVCRSRSMEKIEAARKEFNNMIAAAQTARGHQSLRLANQANALKLVATDKVSALLDELLDALVMALANTNRALDYFGSRNYVYTQSLPKEIMQAFADNSAQIDTLKRSLVAEMKKDLAIM